MVAPRQPAGAGHGLRLAPRRRWHRAPRRALRPGARGPGPGALRDVQHERAADARPARARGRHPAPGPRGCRGPLSPESVVDTVISDLRAATDADHVVVARVSHPDHARRGHARGRACRRAALADDPATGARRARHGAVPRARMVSASSAGDSAGEAAAAAEEIARRVRAEYAPRAHAGHAARGRAVASSARSSSPRRRRDAWSEADRRLLAWAAAEVATAFARAYALEAAERGAKIDALTGPAQPPLLRRGPEHGEAASTRQRQPRRADDRHRPLQDPQRPLRPRHRRPRPARRRRCHRAGRPRRRHAGPLRWRGVRRAPATDVGRAGHRGRRAHPPRRSCACTRPASGIDEPVTVSVGVAVAGAKQVAIPGLVERADQALYRAKRLGRDRVVAA